MINNINSSKNILRFLIIIFLLCNPILQSIKAQPENFEISSAKPGSIDTVAMQQSQKIVSESGGLMEKEIIPEKYIVGPGDILSLSIVTSRTKDYDLVISPEGRIILPDAGIIDVKGKYLSEVEELIRLKMHEIYRTNNIYILIKELRKFKVIVSGAVKKTSIVGATAVDRVSEVIEKAGGLKPDGSLRKIQIHRNDDKEIINVDLLKFFKIGDENANPTVLGGDHIIIPPSSSTQVIAILGEVPSPGEFEFHEGDSLSTLVKFAQGFFNSSYLDSVEYVSLNDNTNGLSKQYLNLNLWQDKIYSGNHLDGDFPLKSGSRVYIRKNPFWKEANEVSVFGEVKYPGKYAVDGKTVRINDVIRRAGGITENASLDAAILIRRSEIGIEDKELERLKKIPQYELSDNEFKYYQARINERQGLMALNFNKIIDNSSSDDNIILVNKDSILIPQKKFFINVQGRVNNPGLVVYKPQYTYLDYINSAGGFGFRSDPNSSLIVKSKGQQFLAQDRNYKIEPGDNILVPPESESKVGEVAAKVLTYFTQIITVIGIVIALVKTK